MYNPRVKIHTYTYIHVGSSTAKDGKERERPAEVSLVAAWQQPESSGSSRVCERQNRKQKPAKRKMRAPRREAVRLALARLCVCGIFEGLARLFLETAGSSGGFALLCSCWSFIQNIGVHERRARGCCVLLNVPREFLEKAKISLGPCTPDRVYSLPVFQPHPSLSGSCFRSQLARDKLHFRLSVVSRQCNVWGRICSVYNYTHSWGVFNYAWT